jgi:hypothetical protein
MNLTMKQAHYMHDYKLDCKCRFIPDEFLSAYTQAHFTQPVTRFDTLEGLFDSY